MKNHGKDSRVTHSIQSSFRYGAIILFVLGASLIPNQLLAQAEKYFPASTKGFVSITNLKDFVERLDKTALGDLRRTPEAKDFFESFVQQVKTKVQKRSKVSLGLTLDELKDIVDGEVAIGLIHPKENVLAIVTIAEFKKAAAVDKALAKIQANLLKAKEKDKKVTLVQKITEAGQTLTHYEFPDPFGIAGPPQVFYGRTDKHIVAYSGPVLAKTNKADHVAQVRLLLKALAGEKQKSLAERDLYKATMKNLMDGDKYKNHQAKWFIESFGFVDAAKKVWPKQLMDVPFGSFRKVGFDSIKSAGGIGMITPGEREFHVRGFLYAPPVDEKNRFRLAAKMLDFTADDYRLQNLPVWVDNTSSSFFAMHVRMLNAFNSSEKLIDELYGEGTMNQILDNFLKNPKLKANFDLRNELAANLGDRAMVVRDPSFPANLENKRVVMVIDIAKELNPTAGKIELPPVRNGKKDDAKKDEKKKGEPKKADAKGGKKADAKTRKLTRREQVAKVIKGYMANEDPNFVERIVHEVNGEKITIFKKITPKDDPGGDPGDLPDLDDLDDLDDLADEPKPAAKKGGIGAGMDPIITYYCVAQYKDQIFVSPDLKFMKQVLSMRQEQGTFLGQDELV